jgi:hypothetical protein
MMSWLALGGAAALQLVAGVVRVRGWFHIIRKSCPGEAGVRYRDVAVAQLGGCGWNAVLPARAGDAVKVALVNRRTPHTSPATLACTLAAPGVVDGAFTAVLVAALVAAGALSPEDLALPAFQPGPVLAGAACAGLLAAVVFRHRLKRLARDARAGLKALGQPRFMLARVAPWHAASRVLRLLALALVLVAAGVPFGIVPALVLMALQGATPSMAPAATAVRVAMVAGAFAATSTAVEPGRVAAVLIAWYAVSSVTNLTASATVTAWVLRTVSPRRIVGYARTAFATVAREPAGPPATPAPAPATRTT